MPKPIEIVGAPPEGVSTVTIEEGVRTPSVLGYVRISKGKDGEELSPETQRRVIREYCHLQGLGTPTIYEEVKSARTVAGRPVLQMILEMCRAGQVKHLVVQDLTRLLRSELREALGLLEELEARCGVELHGAKDVQVDPTTAEGEYIRNMRLINSRFERRRVGERTSRVLRATKAVREQDKDLNPAMADRYRRGALLIGKPPFGYRWRGVPGPAGRGRSVLVPCPTNHPILLRIHELAGQGLGPTAIAQRLRAEGLRCVDRKRKGVVVSRETIHRVLKRGWV